MRHTATILVIEDDPDVGELLLQLLTDEGHRAIVSVDGVEALDAVTHGKCTPDLVLTDYNLPNGMDGLQIVKRLRSRVRPTLPAIVLTGDISTETLRDIGQQNCAQLNKPVKLQPLTELIQRLLAPITTSDFNLEPKAATRAGEPVVYIVDDDRVLRGTLRSLLEEAGQQVEDFQSCEAFLAAWRPGIEACLLIDAYLPDMSGLELLTELRNRGELPPAIMITGNSDVSTAVQAMKAGALDFIEKPVSAAELLASVARALVLAKDASAFTVWHESAAAHATSLTPRQREIMDLVLAGHPSKNIAADLGISQRTVENHRAAIMDRMGAKSLPELARLALAADWKPTDRRS